jgi:hypothetical protein
VFRREERGEEYMNLRYDTYLPEDFLMYVSVESENGEKGLEDLELDVHRLVGHAGEGLQNPR